MQFPHNPLATEQRDLGFAGAAPGINSIQLALPMTPKPLPRLEELELLRSNPGLQDRLTALLQPDAERQMFFWGEPGTGRSSLLQAICSHFFATGAAVALLDCALGQEQLNRTLAGLHGVRLLCLDNLDSAHTDPTIQETLMDYWRRRDTGEPGSLLLTATAPPDRLHLLPDLASRLAAGAVYRLTPLDEAGRVRALRRRAREKAVPLSEQIAAYIVRHSRQDMASNIRLLERVLEISRAGRRAITVPLVRQAALRR